MIEGSSAVTIGSVPISTGIEARGLGRKRARARSAGLGAWPKREWREDDVEIAAAERGRGFAKGVDELAPACNEPIPKLARAGEAERHGQTLGHLRSAKGIGLKNASHTNDAGLLLLKLGLALLDGSLDLQRELVADGGD